MGTIIRLLFAADNPQDASLTRAHFNDIAPDFSIEFASTGATCLSRLAEQPFDLLLLDNNLPDMDSLDVLSQLRADGRMLPVVMVTGADDAETAATALRAGADDYVSRSWVDHLAMLPDLLRRTVARQRSSPEPGIRRLLYIEPDAMDAAQASQHFTSAAPHLQLSPVATCRDALELLATKNDFDLVLADLRAADMDAMELFREAQHLGIDLPFVVITARGEEAAAIDILRLGAYDCLAKDENYLVQLPHAIDHALHRFHLDQSTRRQNAQLTALNASLEEKVAARTAELRKMVEDYRQAEAKVSERERRLQAIIDTEPECVKVIDRSGNLLEMNSAGLAMLEVDSLREAQQQSLLDFILPESREAFRALHQRILKGERATLEFEIAGRKGTRRWLETHAAPMRDETGEVALLLGITRDITQRKADEAKIQRLTQLYAALSQCNQAIVRCADEDQLFQQICRDAVNFGGMKMAWIGMVAAQTRQVNCVAAFGSGTDYLQGILISTEPDHPNGRGPVGTSIREDRPYWCQDFQHDPATAPWHERGARVGWGAIASLPIHRGEVAIGALALYADEPNYFDDTICNLLVEMADDISFALDNFDRDAARKHVEEALRASEHNLQDAQQLGRIGSYISELAADAWTSSAMLDDILGIGRDFPRTTAGWLSIVHPAHRDSMIDFLRKLIDEHQAVESEFRILRANDGAERWVMVRGKTEFDDDGAPLRVAGIIQDITARKESDAQLELASKVFEQSGEGFFITDANRDIIRVNKSFTTISGHTEAEVLGQKPRMLYSGRQDEDFYRAMWAAIDRDGFWQGELLDSRKDGSVYSKWLSISRVLDEHGRLTHYVGIFNDITQHKRDEEHIQRLAHFDALTGLPNRVLLKDRISHSLSSALRSHTQLAVLFLDLDHFKNVNDSLGHRIGDELLIKVAERLNSAIREEDTASRLGGDEFILVLQDTDADGAAHVAEKLLALIALPYSIEQHELAITPSIGIAIFPADGETFDTLSKCADAAMYRAKRDGRNNFCFFTAEMQENAARRLKLENALRYALERDQFSLHFQPQLSLARGTIVGTEALLRWNHPEFGQVSPDEFIPVAEDSGLILPIGEWVLRTAIHQMKDWIRRGMDPMVIAVNLSAVQFRNPKLPVLITRLLDEAQLPPHYLELELTESVAMDDPLSAISTMDELHRRGIRMSIDDFGTGYSSLSYLKRFHVYKLKIDRSFVNDISGDMENRAIVDAIINLAVSLGMQTIAEGVETEEQLQFLSERGCNEIQGYYFSKPVPADRFETFVREKQDVIEDRERITRDQS